MKFIVVRASSLPILIPFGRKNSPQDRVFKCHYPALVSSTIPFKSLLVNKHLNSKQKGSKTLQTKEKVKLLFFNANELVSLFHSRVALPS